MMADTKRYARRPEAGFMPARKLARGPNGRCLCRQCGTEVPKGRRTFCSSTCVDEWLIRNNTEAVRSKLFQRDKGICRLCGIDTVKLRAEIITGWNSPDYRERAARARELGFDPGRLTWWDADHIVPVAEGGGGCGLDNYQTLCLPCHKRETRALRRRLRSSWIQVRLEHGGTEVPFMVAPHETVRAALDRARRALKLGPHDLWALFGPNCQQLGDLVRLGDAGITAGARLSIAKRAHEHNTASMST